MSLLPFVLALPGFVAPNTAAETTTDKAPDAARAVDYELLEAYVSTQAPPGGYDPRAPAQQRKARPVSYMQGLLGVSELRVKDVDFDSSNASFDSEDDATMPLLGGAVQRVLTGDKLHLGLEGGFLMGWMGNVEAIVIGSGGAAVAADNDVFMLEAFGGLYADIMLGEKMRVYAGAGPLVDWAHVDYEYNDPVFGHAHASGDGFGLGVYTRLGFDFLIDSGMRVGFCWRWFESDIDLGGRLDDMEVDGMQYMLTFTRSM